jgi:hypothetical protein
MKIKYLIIVFALLSIISCQNKEKTPNETTENPTIEKTELAKIPNDENIKWQGVDEIFTEGEELADAVVHVEGVIEHVCHHTWKRFKIVDEDHGHFELKIELGDDFDTVNNSIIGEKVKVIGTLVPMEMDAEMVKKWEAKMRENHKGEEDTEHFKEEMAMIQGIHEQIMSGEIEHFTMYSITASAYELQ